MKYAFLIYADESSWTELPPETRAELRAQEMPKWISAMEELAKADPNMTGFELDDGDSATVVRVRNGERIVTDGPFAETKEILGGAFVVELADLDDAIRLASIIPTAVHGTLEIRPVVE